MQITNKKLTEIRPYAHNPRHNEYFQVEINIIRG